MTGHELQQQLDLDGFAVVPPGTTSLDVPLFLGGGAALVGPARQACRLEAYTAGTALVVGWRRGLVPDDHYVSGGFRTRGTCHLFARGTELDIGPSPGGRAAGWSSLPSLRIEYAGTRHGPTWVYHVGGGTAGEPFEQVLAGVQSYERGYVPTPSPWLLYWSAAGGLTLGLGLWSGRYVGVDLGGDPTQANLAVDVTADLAAGLVTGTVNGTAVTASIPAGDRLADNFDWPFAVGRAASVCNEAGFWGSGGIGDVTVTKCRASSGSWFAEARVMDPRPGTYPGGPSLPLVAAWTSNNSRWLFAVKPAQGSGDSAGNTTVRGLRIESGTGNPLVTIGGVQGGLVLDDVGGVGGTRFLQTTRLAVAYPLTLSDVHARGQVDRQLWLMQASNVAVRDCDLSYGGRAMATLIGCTGLIDNVFIAPPGPPPQDVVIEQQGGVMSYHRIGADYEYTPGPVAFLRVTPRSVEAQDWPTVARVIDCGSGEAPFLVVSPPFAGYAGPVRVERDGLPVAITPEVA
jgi:hypothetical protein